MKKTLKILAALIFCLILTLGSFTVSAEGVGVVDYTQVDNESILSGKRIMFFGDSICYASCELDTDRSVIRGWAGRIGVHNNMQYYNFGRSGASVSDCRGDNTLIAQVNSAMISVQECDMYILHGGTNDAWDSAEVGTFDENDFNGKYDKTTFAGGLEDVLYTIKKKYPNAIFGYIINFKFTNTHFGGRLMDMDEYVDVTKKICDKWGVAYLDLYSNKEVLARLQPATGTYISDGVHPTTAGYDVITPYIEDWLKELVIADAQKKEEEVESNESSAEEITESSEEQTTVSSVESKTESKSEESSAVPTNAESDDNTLLIVAIAVGVLAVAMVTVVIILLLRRKKQK